MTFVVSATPGPNMLYVMTVSARQGVRAAVVAMAGCMTALLIMMSLSAAGLGALLQSFPAVFDALRLAGAAYLAGLATGFWRSQADLAQAAMEQRGAQADRVEHRFLPAVHECERVDEWLHRRGRGPGSQRRLPFQRLAAGGTGR